MSYPYNPDLYGPEHEIFRETFRRFIAEEMEPHVDEWTENHLIPREFWRRAGEAGMLGVDIPEDYGGPGGDFLHRLVIAEELGYSRAGASIAPAFIGDGTAEILRRNGTEEQKRHWLPLMVKGQARFAFALTEPDSGSDPGSMRSTAVRDGDDYVINAAKTYISNFVHADAVMLAVKTDPEAGSRGISVIIVETDRPGFRRGRSLRKMGSNAADTGEIFFDEVRVPVTNRMGDEGGGFKIMMSGINMDRITWPLIAHAAATRAYHETVDFVKNRKAFGQAIWDFQNTQFKLAEIKTELAVGRAFLDEVIRDFIATGKLDPLKCAMAKMWLPEMEGRVIDQCVQLHGGAGYMDEYTVSRLYTAARLHRIFAGTAEIMRVIVARSI
ncbi:acyl-CoA dehydrogenase family protein [Sphingosinicella terrae]|uniref:acyl-CoA dehydrogenase family protein n=1 Tax=Sphingosinicella terrae TaxID=2172047 RepID=UPI000E0D0D08|nr:acyl-CoA dehydrogenase family protein [Sphingosinicella terrae]